MESNGKYMDDEAPQGGKGSSSHHTNNASKHRKSRNNRKKASKVNSFGVNSIPINHSTQRNLSKHDTDSPGSKLNMDLSALSLSHTKTPTKPKGKGSRGDLDNTSPDATGANMTPLSNKRGLDRLGKGQNNVSLTGGPPPKILFQLPQPKFEPELKRKGSKTNIFGHGFDIFGQQVEVNQNNVTTQQQQQQQRDAYIRYQNEKSVEDLINEVMLGEGFEKTFIGVSNKKMKMDPFVEQQSSVGFEDKDEKSSEAGAEGNGSDTAMGEIRSSSCDDTPKKRQPQTATDNLHSDATYNTTSTEARQTAEERRAKEVELQQAAQARADARRATGKGHKRWMMAEDFFPSSDEETEDVMQKYEAQKAQEIAEAEEMAKAQKTSKFA